MSIRCETSGASATGCAATASPPFKLGYRPMLDGVRGVAILLVVFYHCDTGFALFGHRLAIGYFGVNLFFSLSGFLITALLLQEYEQTGSISLWRFYSRRMLRLGPALYLVLASCLLSSTVARSPEEMKGIHEHVLLSACYAGNFSWMLPRHYFGLVHTWSLAVEEHFYLVWPFILWGLLRLRLSRRALATLLPLGMVASGLARAVLAAKWNFAVGCLQLPGCADSILGGCLVALLASWGRLPQSGTPRRILQWCAGTITAVLICFGHLAPQWSSFTVYVGNSLIAVAAAVIIAALLSSPPRYVRLFLSAPPMVWIGRLSYALYLWHWLIMTELPRLWNHFLPDFQLSGWPLVIASLVLTFLLAALVHYAVERPLLRLKNRLKRVDLSRNLNRAPWSRALRPSTLTIGK